MVAKKLLIGFTGLILILYMILSAAYAPAATQERSAAVGSTSTTPAAVYTAREENDRIVIYSGNAAWMKTETRVSHLPKIDRLRLREGIDLFSKKELKQFLEDYCS